MDALFTRSGGPTTALANERWSGIRRKGEGEEGLRRLEEGRDKLKKVLKIAQPILESFQETRSLL